MTFRPQKAPSTSIRLDQIRYPMLASYKLDGIRCTIKDERPMSTSNKLLPSRWAQTHYGKAWCEGFDGELICRSAQPESIYRETMSAVMTRDCIQPLIFYVFDIDIPNVKYIDRLKDLQTLCHNVDHIEVLCQHAIGDEADLLFFENKALNLGHEGVMLRTMNGFYKHGRCTLDEYNIFKFVRHVYGEFRILGFFEQMENMNEKTTSETGLSTRSSHQANKRGKGTLGGFHCQEVKTGVLFDCGTGEGLDAALRADIWANQEAYAKRIGRYKSKPYGIKDKPRQPIWTGWRDARDMPDDNDEEDDDGEAF